MAHSFIIQVGRTAIKKEDYFTIHDMPDDHVLLSHADWGGDEADFGEQAGDISSQLKPVASISQASRTLTFKNERTLAKLYIRGFSDVLRRVSDSLCGKMQEAHPLRSHSEIIGAIDRVAETSWCLFYYGDSDSDIARCHTLSEFILDRLNGRLPKQLFIGGLLWFHF